MFFCASLTLTLAATAWALPTSSPSVIHAELTRRQTATQNISTVGFQLNHLQYKYAEAANNFQQNTGKVLPILNLTTLANGNQKRQVSEDMNEWANAANYWAAQVGLGTPPQNLLLNFDTGSSDTWVPGSLNRGQVTNGYKVYYAFLSSTKQFVWNKIFYIVYGSGFALGVVYKDIATFGNVYANNFYFAACNIEGQQFIQTQAQGLSGVGWQTISRLNTPTLPQTLYEQGKIPQNVFGMSITHLGKSVLTLGGYDSSQYTGDFTWIPLSNQGFWQFSNMVLSVNGKSLKPAEAIVDSGTTLAVLSVAQVDQLFSNVPGANRIVNSGSVYYSYPCSTPVSFVVNIQGVDFPLKDSTTVWQSNDGTCLSGFFGYDIANVVILGDIFYRNYYIAHDYANSRIGIAKKIVVS